MAEAPCKRLLWGLVLTFFELSLTLGGSGKISSKAIGFALVASALFAFARAGLASPRFLRLAGGFASLEALHMLLPLPELPLVRLIVAPTEFLVSVSLLLLVGHTLGATRALYVAAVAVLGSAVGFHWSGALLLAAGLAYAYANPWLICACIAFALWSVATALVGVGNTVEFNVLAPSAALKGVFDAQGKAVFVGFPLALAVASALAKPVLAWRMLRAVRERGLVEAPYSGVPLPRLAIGALLALCVSGLGNQIEWAWALPAKLDSSPVKEEAVKGQPDDMLVAARGSELVASTTELTFQGTKITLPAPLKLEDQGLLHLRRAGPWVAVSSHHRSNSSSFVLNVSDGTPRVVWSRLASDEDDAFRSVLSSAVTVAAAGDGTIAWAEVTERQKELIGVTLKPAGGGSDVPLTPNLQFNTMDLMFVRTPPCLVAADSSGQLVVWDKATGKPLHHVGLKMRPLLFCEDEGKLLVLVANGVLTSPGNWGARIPTPTGLYTLDLTSGALEGVDLPATEYAHSLDARHDLILVGERQRIRLFDRKGKLVQELASVGSIVWAGFDDEGRVSFVSRSGALWRFDRLSFPMRVAKALVSTD